MSVDDYPLFPWKRSPGLEPGTCGLWDRRATTAPTRRVFKAETGLEPVTPGSVGLYGTGCFFHLSYSALLFVTSTGFEPVTRGLKVHCAAICAIRPCNRRNCQPHLRGWRLVFLFNLYGHRFSSRSGDKGRKKYLKRKNILTFINLHVGRITVKWEARIVDKTLVPP